MPGLVLPVQDFRCPGPRVTVVWAARRGRRAGYGACGTQGFEQLEREAGQAKLAGQALPV
jgi:hypothetical protein